MSPFRTVSLIGFGEVGQRLAADLAKTGAKIAAYDVLFGDPSTNPPVAIGKTSVRTALDAADAVRGADLVISAVTAARDVEAARSVLRGLEKDTYFLDMNSASPNMKVASQGLIDGAGGRYVEAAVMTPIHPNGIGSYMLLGGSHAASFIEKARPLGFNGEVFADTVGKASATKMCRSVIIKGVEALISESMLAARHYGVEKTVLDSLSDLLPRPDWDRTARYMISRSLEHGTRRAEEMREAAKTMTEAGIEPLMADATARRQDWSAGYKDALAKKGDLGAMLDAIRTEIDTDGRAKAARRNFQGETS